MKKIFVIFFWAFALQLYSQNVIELRSDEKVESKIIGTYLKENNLYVLNSEKLNLNSKMFYMFYKIDLDRRKILNKIRIEDGEIYKDPYFKDINDSIYLLNKSTFNYFASYFVFDSDLKTQRGFKKTNIADYVNSQGIPFFNDFNYEKIYFDGKQIEEGSFAYFSLEDKSVYTFKSSYKTKNISFSKVDSKSSYKKTYAFKELPNYVNDFTEYSKFRYNSSFFPSINYIFVTPEIRNNAINLESFYYLKFDKKEGGLVKIGIPSVNNIGDCDKIKPLSKSQYEITNNGKGTLIQFGVDKDQNFCVCESKKIGENFSYQDIKEFKQKKLYIGYDSESKTAKVYFD
ncbi:hypothetical protein [Flavobacterium sp. FlaQc-28]|uniref:hypothetical protein n=1 Tax=Flavobacterium sp. FlaQc-28 TaxID=3374178 RepID=UPI0037571E4A